MKLAKSRLHTQRRHLDHKLSLLKGLERVPPPPTGWIRAIRESLGITTRQMGKLLGISGVGITKMEQREQSRSITLRDLERAAQILGCRLSYALIPVDTLESTLQKQAQKTAARLSRKADHAMKLEEQQVEKTELKIQTETLAKLLAESLDSRLWEKENKK